MNRGIMVITLGQLLADDTRESYSNQQRMLFQFSLDLYKCPEENLIYQHDTNKLVSTNIRIYVSPRTGKLYGILRKTSIFKHFIDINHNVLPSKFEIISFAYKNNIFLFKNIFIHQLKTSLNGTLYSTSLDILN